MALVRWCLHDLQVSQSWRSGRVEAYVCLLEKNAIGNKGVSVVFSRLIQHAPAQCDQESLGHTDSFCMLTHKAFGYSKA